MTGGNLFCLYFDVFKIDNTAGVMSLQCKCSVGYNTLFGAGTTLNIVWLCVIHYGFIIDFYSHMLACHLDILGKPFAIFHISFFHILYAIEAAGTAPVGMRVIHLHFIAF